MGEFLTAAGLEQATAVDGVWKFSADGHVFGVTADDSGANVFVFGEVSAPPPDREDAFRKMILEANYFGRGTGGAVFSISPETGAYMLVQSERLDCLDRKSFFSLVEKFVNTLATWKGIADAARGNQAAEHDGAALIAVEGDEAGNNLFGSSGFMQV